MAFAITLRRASLDFNGASLFIRFAGREVYINRPEGQPFRVTEWSRSGTDLEVWALGFYGCVC